MAKEYGKKVFFANIVKGGTSAAGKKYGDFISVFKDIQLKKDMVLNLQTPKERVEELQKTLEFQQEKGYSTEITESMLENAQKTLEKDKVRFVVSYQEVKNT